MASCMSNPFRTARKTKGKSVRQIIANIFSPETLEWLCLQE